MFGLLIFIPLTAVIILKSTRNYTCLCKRCNSVLHVSQYYKEPFSEHSLQIEEPYVPPEEEPYVPPEEEPYVPPEEEPYVPPEEEPYVPPEEEPSYDPDMKLIFASNMLFANSTKNNSSIFEQQIHIKLSIQSMDFHTYSQ